ncbi:MAG: chemotaxis protein CheX [Phycisphaerae bacterium]|nr:chemotaxis protein CheX [Phycisphaerae bacterium]
MIQDQKTATLTTIFSEVLADLAFMFNDEEADYGVSSADVWLETEISYHGAQSGTLCLWCTRTFSVQLAANLLGVDPHESYAEEQGNDAVKEFMNIVCGQFITAIHGTGAVFDLTIPTLTELPETPRFPQEHGSHFSTVYVEGQRLCLRYKPGPGSE